MSLFLPLGTGKKEHGLKFALRYLKDPHFREAPRLCKSSLIVHRPYSVASSYRHSAMSAEIAAISAPTLIVAATLLLFQLLDAMPLIGLDLARQRNVPIKDQVGY
jgi:hypothetical protein